MIEETNLQGLFILHCVELCCIITCSRLSVFLQLSLDERGIATKGMDGLLGGKVQDDQGQSDKLTRTIIHSKTIFSITLYFISALTLTNLCVYMVQCCYNWFLFKYLYPKLFIFNNEHFHLHCITRRLMICCLDLIYTSTLCTVFGHVTVVPKKCPLCERQLIKVHVYSLRTIIAIIHFDSTLQ